MSSSRKLAYSVLTSSFDFESEVVECRLLRADSKRNPSIFFSVYGNVCRASLVIYSSTDYDSTVTYTESCQNFGARALRSSDQSSNQSNNK